LKKSEPKPPDPKPTMIPVLAAIIRNASGQILLAQRKPGQSNALKWEFPGGKLKAEESPEACLRREINEELGIEIEVEHPFAIVNYAYPDRQILLLGYLCRYIKGEMRLQDHTEVRWIGVSELLNYDLSPADVPIAQKLVKEREGRN